MKTFTKEMEIKLNGLAIEIQSGNNEAQDEFFSIMFPMIQSYAKKFRNTFIDSEDLANEFSLSALKAISKYKADSKQNVSGLVFVTCKNDFLKLKEKHDAEKRAKYRDNLTYLDKEVGDGKITLNEVVSGDSKSTELLVEETEQQVAVREMISEFCQVSKGRHGQIIEAVYKGFIVGLENDELEQIISDIIFAETNKVPTKPAIRKAKSRALETIREALESGKVGLSSQV